MSIHAVIGVYTDKNNLRWKGRYIHMDGDPESTGRHLIKEYKRLYEEREDGLRQMIHDLVAAQKIGWNSLMFPFEVLSDHMLRERYTLDANPTQPPADNTGYWECDGNGISDDWWAYILSIEPHPMLNIYKGRDVRGLSPIRITSLPLDESLMFGLEPAADWQAITAAGNAHQSLARWMAVNAAPSVAPRALVRIINYDPQRDPKPTSSWEEDALGVLLNIRRELERNDVTRYAESLENIVTIVKAYIE